jgi:hypothetical protein
MTTLRLIPVARDVCGESKRTGDLVELAGTHAAYGLRQATAGKLVAEPLESAETPDDNYVAILRRETHGDNESWFLLRRSHRVGVNGITPTLPLMVLEPGALLSLEDRFWMASLLWIPTPATAPDDLADKKCPVCGGELKLAPVVKCLCGRWVHLEKPDTPDDPDALNCFFEGGRCGSCGHPATLAPQVIPEPPAALIGRTDEADEEWDDEPVAVSAALEDCDDQS